MPGHIRRIHRKVMGILNVTPDSFSDGGRYTDVDSAVSYASEMIRQGADIIDIGGESTRPGAQPVSADQELSRIIPVIEALTQLSDVTISVDTMKPEVMYEACRAGAGMINDVNALQAADAIEIAAQSSAQVCLMHMLGTPRTMQSNPQYNDVVAEVTGFLSGRIQACLKAGIAADRIIVDPGFGFGKTVQHNLDLLDNLYVIGELGYPVLVGLSRKSMLGKILDEPVPENRIHGGTAAAVLALQQGANIVRTHDVESVKQAIRLFDAIDKNRQT